jgi:hypothetical protein
MLFSLANWIAKISEAVDIHAQFQAFNAAIFACGFIHITHLPLLIIAAIIPAT